MKKSFSAFLVALSFCCAAVAAAPEGDIVRVNSVVVAPAKSIGAAEAAAKKEALTRVLAMRGNDQIKGQMPQILKQVDDLVSVRHVLNKDPVGGVYQPAFYFDVDMDRINGMIVASTETAVADYANPRIQVAIVIRRLPAEVGTDADREVYVDDINDLVKEYYGRAGFNLVDFLNIPQDKLYAIESLRDLEKAVFSPENPPTAVDYYLMGQIDAPSGSIQARDGGAYHKANVKLQITMLDLNSGQPVTARRTVEGTGESARSAFDNALRNVVKAVEEKASGPDIVKTWKRNIKTGLSYEITYCDRELKYAYFDDLHKALTEYGAISGNKSDVVPLYEFRFPGGRAIDPAREFERMLSEVQSRTGLYADTEMHPIIYNKHKVFMFGNTEDCFGMAANKEVIQ